MTNRFDLRTNASRNDIVNTKVDQIQYLNRVVRCFQQSVSGKIEADWKNKQRQYEHVPKEDSGSFAVTPQQTIQCTND